jgi:hypothetical protein
MNKVSKQVTVMGNRVYFNNKMSKVSKQVYVVAFEFRLCECLSMDNSLCEVVAQAGFHRSIFAVDDTKCSWSICK